MHACSEKWTGSAVPFPAALSSCYSQPYKPERCPRPMSVRRSFIFSLALGAAALLWLAGHLRVSAHQNAPPARVTDQSTILPLDGAKIFRNYCASCHGVNGKGGGPVAPALKAKVPQLSTLARRNHGTFPTARVRGIIAGDEDHAAHGSREMPLWGPVFHQIENDQDLGYIRLQNVMQYLKTIQQK
jgi:mono/diheme cytochrome c family protein